MPSRKSFKRGDRVGALVYDNGTTVTPGLVLGRDPERPDKVRVLVHMSTGFEVKRFDAGSRDYLDFPLPETAEVWSGMYAALEAEFDKHL